MWLERFLRIDTIGGKQSVPGEHVWRTDCHNTLRVYLSPPIAVSLQYSKSNASETHVHVRGK